MTHSKNEGGENEMKKILIVLLALSILAFAGVVIAGVSAPGINGTPHAISGGEPCAFCHTPHVPTGQPVIYPLWNRSQATQSYTMYTSATFDMYPGSPKTESEVDASTRACMQCHNGQAATLVNYPGRGVSSGSVYDTMTWGVGDGIGNLGTDLRQEHPVAFAYNPALDTAKEDNGFPNEASGKVGTTDLPLYTLTGKAIGSGTTDLMGCGTCHEPHDRYLYDGKATGAGGTQVFFLRNADTGQLTGNAGSAMCKACHVNKY